VNFLHGGEIVVVGADLRELAGVDELVDNEEVVEAVELLFGEGATDIGRFHNAVLYIFDGAPRDGQAAEVEREEGIVAIVLYLNWHFPLSFEYSFLVLYKLAVSDFRNPHSVVEDDLADGLPFHMFQIPFEEKLAHLEVAFIGGCPVLDHDISFR
jgi:hypothetical protein